MSIFDTQLREFLYPSSKFWYFDTNKEKFRKKAELSINSGKPILRLKTFKDDLRNFEKNYDSITTTGSSSRITLFNCRGYRESNIFFDTDTNVRFYSNYLIKQFFDKRKIPFETTNLKGTIPGVQHFFETDFLDYNYSSKKFINDKDLYLEVVISSYIKIELWCGLDIISNSVSSLTATTKSYIKLIFTQPTKYSSAIYCFEVIEDFFNFIFPKITEQCEFESIRKNKRKKYNTLLTIIKNNSVTPEKSQRDSSFEMLFQLSDLSNPVSVIKKWFERYEEFEEIWNNLKYIKNNNLSEKNRFTLLITTIENIHRSYTIEKSQERRIKHLEKLKKIKNKLTDKEDRDFIERQKNLYEPPLAERLKEINNLTKSYGLISLTGKLREKIINTRNSLLHSLKNTNIEKLSISEMYDCNNIMAMQIKIVLLIMIGVSKEEIGKLIQKSNQFKIYYRD